jgi:hypothetical protein
MNVRKTDRHPGSFVDQCAGPALIDVWLVQLWIVTALGNK